MIFKKRIGIFSDLGHTLKEGINNVPGKYTETLQSLIINQELVNPWFTPFNVKMAISAIANELTNEKLIEWTSVYPGLNQVEEKKTIGVVMAGNIPLVGFHDFLSVLITGNRILAKTSSKDSDLLKFIAAVIIDRNPELKDDIEFTEGKLSGFDAIIATGSGNSSRYFEYYFGQYPNIIRKNRNSVAIIDSTETEVELEKLGLDVFAYYGLGCRNVSKIFVPKNYDFDRLIKTWSSYENIANHNKYANNYDHNKAIYLINRENFLETGFVLLKEESSLSSPVAVLNYEYYETIESVIQHIDLMIDNIQCVVGHNYIPFGEAQSPALWNYADGKDTIEFLMKLKK
jgi:hypothetical protein